MTGNRILLVKAEHKCGTTAQSRKCKYIIVSAAKRPTLFELTEESEEVAKHRSHRVTFVERYNHKYEANKKEISVQRGSNINTTSPYSTANRAMYIYRERDRVTKHW